MSIESKQEGMRELLGAVDLYFDLLDGAKKARDVGPGKAAFLQIYGASRFERLGIDVAPCDEDATAAPPDRAWLEKISTVDSGSENILTVNAQLAVGELLSGIVAKIRTRYKEFEEALCERGLTAPPLFERIACYADFVDVVRNQPEVFARVGVEKRRCCEAILAAENDLSKDKRPSFIPTDTERKILLALSKGPLVGKDIDARTGLSEGTRKSGLQNLKRIGLVDNEPKRGYFLTESGVVCISS